MNQSGWFCTLREHRLRLLDRTTTENRAIFLDPARLMRWVYVARVSIASAIFLAAILASLDQPLEDSTKLLLASLTVAAAVTWRREEVLSHT